MTIGYLDSSSSLTPAQRVHKFLKELPSPFREQLLYRLYAFFESDVITAYALEMEPEEALELIAIQSNDYWSFQRAVVLIGALDYLFSQKAPWPSLVESAAAYELSGLKLGAFFPVRDEPYLQARAAWKMFRSKLSYFILRKIEKKVSIEYQQQENAECAPRIVAQQLSAFPQNLQSTAI